MKNHIPMKAAAKSIPTNYAPMALPFAIASAIETGP
jgi:hypothetical protein